MFAQRVASLVLLTACLAVTLPVAAADGKALYGACVACHGSKGEGNAKVGAPNIAGLDAWYIERQLENFTAGRRGTAATDTFGATMKAASSTVATVADRTAVAAYIAALPKVSPGGTASPLGTASNAKGDARTGATQFNAVCSACHQANGQGNKSLAAPRIAGIDPVYLSRQLENFRSGVRGNHPDDKPGKQMAAMAKTLNDAKAVHDVMAHVMTLKP